MVWFLAAEDRRSVGAPWGHDGATSFYRQAGKRSWFRSGKDAVWELDAGSLGELLRYREDPLMPGEHGFVEPGSPMTFERYESALDATRGAWRLSSG